MLLLFLIVVVVAVVAVAQLLTHLWRYIWRWFAIWWRSRWFPSHLASAQHHSRRWYILIHIVVAIHVWSVVRRRQQWRLLVLEYYWTLVTNFRLFFELILKDDRYALGAERFAFLLITYEMNACFTSYSLEIFETTLDLPNSILPLLWRRRCKQQAIIEASNTMTTIMMAGSINVVRYSSGKADLRVGSLLRGGIYSLEMSPDPPSKKGN